MANKDLNLVAFYYTKPRPGVNTTVKGWMNDPNNLVYDERVEITRGLKKDSAHSKIILNLSTKTVAKNSWNEKRDFDALFKHFFKGYHQYITAVMTKLDTEYFNKMLDEMQAETEAKNHKNEEKTIVEVKDSDKAVTE